MEKTIVHIVAHSHWDREWYLPFGKQQMLLVELFDDLLELFENDSSFHSFHLDGHTLLVEDYLKVKPYNRSKIEKLISAKKLIVGPFYILQDAYLTSSEANVRNFTTGIEYASHFGEYPKIGYFPDTFGIMGQAPQMLKQLDIPFACFGRGVKPTGFDNVVVEDESYSSKFSEMNWVAPNGDKVLGILFANWYCNGLDIPANEDQARKYWDNKIAAASKYASTRHLLFMNGCDHTPVQKDLSKAIKLANTLYDNVEFRHTSLEEYYAHLKEELPSNLNTVYNELASQETDGWGTLTNTASSRVYLKQANVSLEQQLEQVVEPLQALAKLLGNKQDYQAQTDYAWKVLMENHPHDSICGCSVDEVHQSNEERFSYVKQIVDHLENEVKDYYKVNVTMTEGKPSFIVVNPTSYPLSKEVTNTVILKKVYAGSKTLQEIYQELNDELSNLSINYGVFEQNNNELEASFTNYQVAFGYDLPKQGFRKPFVSMSVDVTFIVKDLAPFSYNSYYLDQSNSTYMSEYCNKYLDFKINANGSIDIFDKENDVNYNNLLIFEDSSDCGNEYVYVESKDQIRITTNDIIAKVTLLQNDGLGYKVKIEQELLVPVSLDEQLDIEQKSMKSFLERDTIRSKTVKPLLITTYVSIAPDSKEIKFKTRVNNQHKDHRLRVLFKVPFKTDKHYASSIFEVACRSNVPSPSWKNPSNPWQQQAFVGLSDNMHNVVVGNKGLSEYEIINCDTIGLTLFRSVGELGDWGYFKTDDSQCLRDMTFEYSLHLDKDLEQAYLNATYSTLDLPVINLENSTNTLPKQKQLLDIKTSSIIQTCLKVARDNNGLIYRGYAMTNPQLKLDDYHYVITKTNLLETTKEDIAFKTNDIITLRIEVK